MWYSLTSGRYVRSNSLWIICLVGSAVVVSYLVVEVNGLGEGMKKSKHVIGTLEVALCARLECVF